NPDGSLRQPDAEIDSDKAEPAGAPQSAKQSGAETERAISFPGTEDKAPPMPKDEPAGSAAGYRAEPGERPSHPGPLRDSGRGAVEDQQPEALAEPSFVNLVNMLAMEAALHLGLIENPMGGGRSIDLESARHMIDMLGMLQRKTRGNLIPE